MAVPVYIFVGKQIDQSPIIGASVAIDGAVQGVTDNFGSLQVSLKAGSHQISATGTGYVAGDLAVFLVEGGNPYRERIYLDEAGATPALTSQTALLEPANQAYGVAYTFTPADGGSIISGVVLNNDGLIQAQLRTSVSYTLQIGKSGIASQSIALTPGASVTLQLVSTSDPNADRQAAPVQTSLKSVDGSPAVLVNARQDPHYEYIYPNSADGTYFTTTQARLFVGDMFIDELNYCQFALQDNKVPIYGYRSRYFDAIGQGRSLVQGQIGLNFVSEGYLYVALGEYQRWFLSTQSQADQEQQDKQELQQQLADLYTMRQQLPPNPSQAQGLFQETDPDSLDGSAEGVAPLIGGEHDIDDQIAQLQAQLDPKTVQAANQIAMKQVNFRSPSISQSVINAVYTHILFDLEIQLQGAGRTVTRRLEKCMLISNEQILDQSGNGLIDSYGFLARRLR